MLERILPVGTNAKWHGLPDTIDPNQTSMTYHPKRLTTIDLPETL